MAIHQTVKQQAQEMIEQMSDSMTWDDLIERLRFNQAVAEGVAEAERGEFASPDEVKAAFKRWGAVIEI